MKKSRLLLNEFVKNIKIMFRNWQSLSLLVIAPLALILLIGYAFSGENMTGINIGIVSQEEVNLEPLIYNVSTYGTITEFSAIEDCLSEMILQKVHICIVLEHVTLKEGAGNISEIPSGKITYYYDNTRKKVSLLLIQNIQDFFGLKAEQISIESAQSIIENIQNLIGFIDERKEDIDQLKNESASIKKDLIERKAKLEKTRDDFLPPYLVLKDLQKELHNYSSQVNSTSNDLTKTIGKTLFVLEQFKKPPLKDSLDLFEQNNITGNITKPSILFDELETQIKLLQTLVNSTNSDIQDSVTAVDELISKLDAIKILLDEEIVRNDEYIVKIDASVVKIDAISKELDEKLIQLKKLNPDMAEKIVKPILSAYSPVLGDVKNIQLSFPQLLVLIIMFIALLFSNIETLVEINNNAYMRNLIAPVSDMVYVFGMLLTSIIIVFFQIIVLFIVAQTKLGVMITPAFWQISFISLLLITIFILTGMIFAYLFKSIQSSILITTFSALIFFMFSNALAPIEAMPGIARFLSNYNPLVLGEFLIREIQLFETPLQEILTKILILIIYILVLLLIALLLAKKNNKSRV